jgi:polysaccharide pyruvyl transferase WcaK-like protein
MRSSISGDPNVSAMFLEGRLDGLTQADAHIGLLHHIGGGNLGDDATLYAVTHNIKLRLRNAEIVALSMNPIDTQTRHGLVSHPVRRNNWSVRETSREVEKPLKETVKALTRKYRTLFYLLKATNAVVRLPNKGFDEVSFLVSSRRNVKPFDILIICGGGQLTERDGPWAFPYTIFKWVVLARSAGVRCIFLNVGAGPLSRPLSRFFVKRALLASDYVSFRDEKSKALIREIGFTGESRVYPDSAYALDHSRTSGTLIERRDQPIVGFAPMPYPGPRDEYLAEKDRIIYSEFMRKLASFAAWINDQSYGLTFFGTDIGVDPLAIEHLQAELLSHYGIDSSQYCVSHSINTTHDLLAAISGMDYVVTCRFHGVIFAHLLNKPVLAIAHHPKVRDLMADLELSSYCLNVQDFDAKLLEERFVSMVRNAKEIKNRMALSLATNRQKLKTQFDELFGH